eukprot:2313318-Rhodomonas_salina.4
MEGQEGAKRAENAPLPASTRMAPAWPRRLPSLPPRISALVTCDALLTITRAHTISGRLGKCVRVIEKSSFYVLDCAS